MDMPGLTASVTPYLLYLVLIASIGPLQFGYHLGELNAPQKVITCNVDKTPSASSLLLFPPCIPMSASQWGMVQSIFTVGGFCGALIGGPLATSRGRLFATRVVTLPLFVGPILEASASNIGAFGLGRFVSGIGAGAATVVGPIYIAEIAPVDKRGLFGAFTQVMINTGILIAQVLGYFLSKDNLWRVILLVAGVVAMIQFFGLLFAPETPKWLAENDRQQMGKAVLRKLRGPESDIRSEIQHWSRSGGSEDQSLLDPPQRPETETTFSPSSVSFADVIRMPKYRKAVVAVTASMMAQQLCGINSVVMYSVAILGAIIPSAAALVTVIVSAMNVIVTAACAPLADIIGRKTCLLLSIAGMGSSSVLLAIGLQFDIPALSIIAILLFVCSFGVGLGPVPFILASELVGREAVGATSGIALAGNWASTFCVAQFFPMLNHALPRGQVYWIFAGTATIFGLIIALELPESKGYAGPDDVWGAFEGTEHEEVPEQEG